MGKEEHGEKCGGFWVRAKINFHLHFSQLCADFENVSMLVEDFSFFYLLYNHTHLNTWERPQYNHSLVSAKDMLCWDS